MTPHRARSRARTSLRALLAIVAACAPLATCTPSDSTGTGPPAALALVPSFQVVVGELGAEPVDRIAMMARDALTLETVGYVDEQVDPTADEWSIALGIDLGGAASRTVVVEIELANGGAVQWSGRLGPIVVSARPGGSARQVSVYRGPLDNLDVEGLTIVGGPAQMLVGQTAAATADVTLRAGSSAEPEVFWASLDEGVATVTVDALGVASITAVAEGETTVVAVAGAAVDSFDLEVVPLVGVVEILPAAPSLAGLGATVLLAATVFDGLGSPVPGALVTWQSADESIATVDGSGLVTAAGFGAVEITASADGVTGSTTVSVLGPDLMVATIGVLPDQGEEVGNLEGVRFDIDVRNRGPADAPGSTVGVRVIDPATGLEAHPVLLFPIPPLTAGGAYIVQAFPTGQVQPFAAPAELRFEAVADVLDEVAEEDETNNARSSGTYATVALEFTKTWLGGTAGDPTGWSEATNWSPAGVPGTLDRVLIPLTANQPVTGGVAQVAALALDDGATLDLGAGVLEVDGNFGTGATGGVQNGELTVSGAGTVLEGVVDEFVLRTTSRTLTGALTASGSVRFENGDLAPDGNTLSVAGDLTITGTLGRLDMRTGGLVDVEGSVSLAGGNHSGLLTAGTIRVAGNFEVLSTSSPLSFVATGAHTVVLDGSGPQTVTKDNPSTTGQRFFNLTVENQSEVVTFGSDVVVMGTLTIPAGGAVDGADDVLTVAGAFADGSDGTLLQELVIAGSLTAIPPGINGNARVVSNFTAPSSFFVLGDLMVESADLVVGANSVSASGSLEVTGAGAQLIMTDPGSSVEIFGDALFDGTTHLGSLTAGTLLLGGDLTVTSSSTNGFAATGTHATVFNGTAAQSVDFALPGPTQQRFQNLFSNNVNGSVTFLSDVVATGAFSTISDATVDGSAVRFSVGESYTPGGGVSMQEVEIIGDLTAINASISSDVLVSATFTLPGDLTVNGDLTVGFGSLFVGGNTLTLNIGDLTITGPNSRLFMTNAADTVTVIGNGVEGGNVTFAGASHLAALTAGRLTLTGDFTASGDPQAFVGSGDHEVLFVTFIEQVVTMDNPGPTGQRFADFVVANTGPVNLASDVFVMDTFDLADGDMGIAGAPGPTLEIRGTMVIEEATFIGLPVRLVSTRAPALHQVSAFMTFQSMQPSDTQLYMELPGAALAPPTLTLFDVTFDAVQPLTGYYLEVASSNGQAWRLQLDNPSPGSASAGVDYLTDGTVIVIWPFP